MGIKEVVPKMFVFEFLIRLDKKTVAADLHI